MAAFSRSSNAVRYDGVYQCRGDRYFSYLRFFPDGRVVCVTSTDEPERAAYWLDHDAPNHGLYQMNGNSLEFDLSSSGGGSYNYIGSFLSGKLAVTSYSKTDYSVQKYEYTFCPVRDLYTPPATTTPSNNRNTYNSNASYTNRGAFVRSIICMVCGITSIMFSSVFVLSLICGSVGIGLNVSCKRSGLNNGFAKSGLFTSVIGILISLMYSLAYCSTRRALGR